jgi:hypothetical protein
MSSAHKRIAKLKDFIERANLTLVEFIGTDGHVVKARCNAGTSETRMFSLTVKEGDPRGDLNEFKRMERFYREINPEGSMAAALKEAAKTAPPEHTEFKIVKALVQPPGSGDADERVAGSPADESARQVHERAGIPQVDRELAPVPERKERLERQPETLADQESNTPAHGQPDPVLRHQVLAPHKQSTSAAQAQRLSGEADRTGRAVHDKLREDGHPLPVRLTIHEQAALKAMIREWMSKR